MFTSNQGKRKKELPTAFEKLMHKINGNYNQSFSGIKLKSMIIAATSMNILLTT